MVTKWLAQVEHFVWFHLNGIRYHHHVNVSLFNFHQLTNSSISSFRLLVDNPCNADCESCEQKTGVCLRKQTKIDPLICDPPCEDDETCIDGECTWSNIQSPLDDNLCIPSCPPTFQCIHRQCQPLMNPFCPIPCRSGQICIDGRCGCYRGNAIMTNILSRYSCQ